MTSRSRSVALRLSAVFSARISTLARIGMVLRRSTTRWTWPSDFKSSARSTVTFMAATTPRGSDVGAAAAFSQGLGPWNRRFSLRFTALARCRKSLLQVPLQNLDLVGQHGVVADQAFDLAHRMQHGGVIAPAEAAADLR